MRILFGMVVGVALTIGGAYILDQRALSVADQTATQPMVNWTVVHHNWTMTKARIREEWVKLTG